MIFVDTWAWLALSYKQDPYHTSAAQQHRKFQQQKARNLTTDYVLSELITSLFAIVDFGKVRKFMLNLFQSVRVGRYQLVYVSPDQFERAWLLREKYQDKPTISFTDLTSMVVMQDLGITDVFTGDAHFKQVNLGFRLFP